MSKKMRFALLRFLKFIPDEPMIRFQYWMKHHRFLNLMILNDTQRNYSGTNSIIVMN